MSIPANGPISEAVNKKPALRLAGWPGLAVIIIVYLALTLVTTQVLHFSLALDEGYHLELITFIKQHGRLPINYEERVQMARADLPPLYHVLVALVSAGVTIEESPHFKYFGDSFRNRAIDHQADQPYILPTEDFMSPYLGRFLVWQIGRWLSVGLSAATLVIVFLVLQAIPIGAKPVTSLFGAALLAFMPRYLIVGSALNDDNLLGLFAAIYFWMLVKLIKTPIKWFPIIGLGVMLGLATTIKYSLALMPFQIIVILGIIAAKFNLGQRWFFSRLGVAGLLTVLCSGWWFGWNLWFFNTIAKDGLLVGTIRALLMGGYNATLNRVGGILSGEQTTAAELVTGNQPGLWSDWFTTTFLSFWGVNINDLYPLYPFAYIIIGIVLVVAAIGLWQLWRRQPAAQPWLLLTGSHLGLLCLIPLLRFATSGRIGQTAQGRHILIPAAVAVVGLMTWGLTTIIPRRWQRMIFVTIIAGMMGWTGLHLYQLAYFAKPPLPLRTLPQAAEWLAQPVKAKFGDSVELVSYELDPQPEQGQLHLNLAWRSLAYVNENYLVAVTIHDEEGAVVSYWTGYSGQGRLPTLAWSPGDSVFDRLVLPLPNLPPSDYTVQIQLLGRAGPLPVQNSAEPHLVLAKFSLTQPSTLPLSKSLAAGSPTPTFALWQGNGPVNTALTSDSSPGLPNFRYPATISVIVSPVEPEGEKLEVQLVDEAGQAWPAIRSEANIYTFVIGPRWSSGDYRLRLVLGGAANIGEPLLTVENWWKRRFELPAIATPSQANFANQLNYLGYDLPQKQVKAGQSFPLTLYWQALPKLSPQADFIQFNHLVDSEGKLHGGYDRRPLEYYSTLLWAPGEGVVDGYTVPVEAGAPPGQYYLNVGYYLTVGEAAVNLPLVENGQMSQVSSVTIGPIEVVAP